MRISDWSSDVCSSDLVPWESTAYLFEGEYVWVEVEAANALPVAEIPILLGRNGKPARDDSGRLLLAHRTAGNPRLYRTGPIYLQRGLPPGAFRLAKPGRSHTIGAADAASTEERRDGKGGASTGRTR